MPYDESWDRPHTHQADELWQESDCYWSYDDKAKIGIYHRLGQYPHTGSAQLSIFAFKVGGKRFRMMQTDHPGGGERWETGQRIGSSTAESLGDKKMRFDWDEPECSADLEFYESFYDPRSWDLNTSESGLDTEFNAEGHLEVSGRLRGTLRLGNETFDVDALAHRDRSWGKRDVSRVFQHRQTSGTLGPQLCWNVVRVQLLGGGEMTVGFLVRDGKHEQVKDLKMLTRTDNDGLSILDSEVRMITEAGETISISGLSMQGFNNQVKDYVTISDSIMTTTKGGLCYYTAALNPFRGVYMPSQAEVDSICMTTGLSASIAPLR